MLTFSRVSKWVARALFQVDTMKRNAQCLAAIRAVFTTLDFRFYATMMGTDNRLTPL